MKSSPIEFDAYQGNDTYIESLFYDLDELRIIVAAGSQMRIEVLFCRPIGFRCLDEGDLLEFWENPEITQNWIVQIHDSGWFQQESNRSGFLSKNTVLKEFLIKGQNDCISVLNTEKPKLMLLEAL